MLIQFSIVVAAEQEEAFYFLGDLQNISLWYDALRATCMLPLLCSYLEL